MHSSTMSLSQEELDEHIDGMIALLEDPGPLSTINSAKDCVQEICKVLADISIQSLIVFIL